MVTNRQFTECAVTGGWHKTSQVLVPTKKAITQKNRKRKEKEK